MNKSLFSALWLEKMAMSITIGLIVMVAALNIIASLILLVMEKTRDIAILKTMGASRASIRRIFMLQGLIIGIVGTVGRGRAAALIYVLDRYKLIRACRSTSTRSSTCRSAWSRSTSSSSSSSAVLVCFVATIYPSRQAAKLDPAQALRYQSATRLSVGARTSRTHLCCIESPASRRATLSAARRCRAQRPRPLRSSAGEMVAIVGASGWGRARCCTCSAAWIARTRGSIWIGESTSQRLSDDELVAFRNRHVGFVFQFHHLLPEFTASRTPRCRCASREAAGGVPRAARTSLLQRVGLAERLDHRPGMLSGGESSASRSRARS